MIKGFIVIHRKLINWGWWEDHNTTRLFLYLLLRANWQKGEWKGIEIDRGELVTGRKKLSQGTGLTEQQIRRCLNNLQTTNEITIKTTNRFSIITICNYDAYQDKVKDKQPTEQPTVSQKNNQQTTTNEQRNKEQQRTKRLKDKQICANNSKYFDLFWRSYPNKKAKEKAREYFERLLKANELPDTDILLSAIEVQKKSKEWTKKNGEYIPLPGTWLNGKRWKDEMGNGNQFSEEEVEFTGSVMKYLNDNSPYEYAPLTDTVFVGLVSKLLRGGFKKNDIGYVVKDKCEKWGDDPEKREWLKPTTLFREEKFIEYLAQAKGEN